MKKIQYIRPEVRVCELEGQQNVMLTISNNTPANSSDVLVNDNKFTDIWGNEY